MFGAKLPTFNINGETEIQTATGGILTFFVLVVFSIYAILKFTHLVGKKNPLIAELQEKNFYDFNTKIDFSEIGFKMAYTVEGYLDGKMKDNPRYVKVFARIFYKTDGKEH